MKTKKLWRYISIVVAVLLVLVAVGTVLGQEPEPPDEDSVTPVPPLPDLEEDEEDTGPAEGEGDVGAAGEMDIVAHPTKTMNYQGYLTDGSGNPLDGTYDMTFSLYDAETGGTQEWGPETHNNVQVNDGLFSVALGETVAMDPYDIFYAQMYLQITVDGTALPRQMLRAVPYAMALTAGARVRGETTSSTDYGLWVSNSNGPGIYANGTGVNVYGLYSADAIYSDDGYAGPNTFVWVPAQNAVLDHDDVLQAHLEYQNYGEVRVESDVPDGIVDVHIPIQIEQPYGRDYLLRSARIYYMVDHDAYITTTRFRGRNFDTGATLVIGSDTDDEASTTFDYCYLGATDYYTITERMAPTNLDITIDLNSTVDTVYLYGVRLTLDSTY